MSGSAILVAIDGTQANDWIPLLKARAGGRDLRFWPDAIGDKADIAYAFVWRPPQSLLASLPNLKAILNIGAGVDALLSDPTLPPLPLARAAHPDLTRRVTGYVVLHVLAHHNRSALYAEQQRNRIWKEHRHPSADEVAVGVMGMGVIGGEAAQVLARLGFQVAGWSRSAKSVAGVTTFSGDAQLDGFLRRTEILVCLLPHTPETTGLIDRPLIRKLSRKGPLGAPVLINAGRGKQQVEGLMAKAPASN